MRLLYTGYYIKDYFRIYLVILKGILYIYLVILNRSLIAMYRFVEDKLVQWKNRWNRKPLIVRGARQVGKTYSIMEFGKKHFPGNVYKIDLEQHMDLHPIFEQNLDVNRIVAELELVMNIKIEPGRDLLFFDEIQSAPRALMALRYFYENMPELHVIAAGSLLEFALKDVAFPVGRVQFLEMFPMSFKEFLIANDNDRAVKILEGSLNKITPVSHQYLIEQLRKYFFIGGMPECVKTYVETKKFKEVFEVQTALINTFREDFSKYAPYADKRCINTVLINSARNVGKQVIYTHLSDGFTVPTIKKAFDLLNNARLIYRVHSVSPVGFPLGASISARKFKVLFVDIGLMQNLCGIQAGEEYYKKDLLDIYNGSLAEQFVGQEIISYLGSEIFYWAREAKSSTAEIDYLVEHRDNIYPIEVKSGSAGRLKSLHLFLKTYPNVPYGYILSMSPYGYIPEQKIKFIPIYAAGEMFRIDN